MSYSAKSDTPRMPDAPASKYACCFAGCPDIGVWSPTVVGAGPWFCRHHAGLPQPTPHRRLEAGETELMMLQIFGRAFVPQTDDDLPPI